MATDKRIFPDPVDETIGTSPEKMLALALLAIEPEKIEGGSKPRRDWLGLITENMMFLMEYGYNYHAFKNVMNGYPEDWKHENY